VEHHALRPSLSNSAVVAVNSATEAAKFLRDVRAKPGHAWTNGFVERLQGTILHEHWRIAFRPRYFRKRFQLQASLNGFLQFCNFERPHQGYRTKGRTPAELF